MMPTFKAHVLNGQIVLDEPAELPPEGTALEINPVASGSNDTEPSESSEESDPYVLAMNAALAKLSPEEIETDLRVVRAAARATMKRNPW